MRKVKIEFKNVKIINNLWEAKLFVDNTYIGEYRFDSRSSEGELLNGHAILAAMKLSINRLNCIVTKGLPDKEPEPLSFKAKRDLSDLLLFDYYILKQIIEEAYNNKPLCVLFTKKHCYKVSNKDAKKALNDAYSEVGKNETVIKEYLIRSINDIEALKYYDYDDKGFEKEYKSMPKSLISKERVIVLKDDYERLYVFTNAPAEVMEEAIEHRDNVLLNEDSPASDFEIIQEYLNAKGYTFEETNIEEYYW